MQFLNSLTGKNAAYAGAAFMVAGGALFAIVNTGTQYTTSVQGLSSSSMAFWQYFVALLAMLPWLLKTNLSILKTNRLGLHIFRVVISAFGVQFWLYALANGIPIWQAIALLMTSPFFVTIGAALVLKEEVGPARIAATLAGFVGGMIVLEPWSDSFTMTALFPVIAAALWAISSINVKQLSSTDSPQSITLYLLLLLAPINAALWGMEIFGSDSVDKIFVPTANMWPYVIGIGALTALAQVSIAWCYKVADAAYVSPFDHVKMPFNILAGFIVFGYFPTGNFAIGAGIIVVASLFIMQHEARRLKTATA